MTHTHSMAGSTRVQLWIVEDDAQYRESLAYLIARTPGLECRRVFSTAEAVVRELDRDLHDRGPDVVLMDVNLPGMSGVACLVRIKTQFPDTKVIMLTIRDDRETIFDALCSGASGYVLKNCPVDELVAAIEQASRGGMLMPGPVARMVMTQLSRPSAAAYGLSVREQEVLTEMVEGFSQKEIAARLGISTATVNVHVQHIYQKLHVNCSNAAVVKALRERLI